MAGGAGLLLLTWRRGPALRAAAVAYTVAVLPQSGFFQNGPQLVANRYSYLAAIPLALLAGAGFTMASRRRPKASIALASAIVVALASVTLVNLPMWRDSDAMWHYAARHEPTCTQCQDMASAAALRHGDLQGAIRHQEQAIRVSDTTMSPRWERHWNMATLLIATGQPEQATQQLRVYLAAVPPGVQEVEPHRNHIRRARAMLAHLDGQH